jgi:predicted Zn-dependent protease
VNRIGQSLAARSERPQLAWEFTVVDDASVNAFALPGGFIFVTRGLLTHMSSEAELASVLGHENGHVTARHAVQQLSRQQVAALGLGIGAAISPTIAEYGPLASAGVGLLFLKYGRDDETQADQLGFKYALSQGYDTREMRVLFQMLQRDAQASGVGRLPEWRSSHPDPGNRLREVDRLVRASSQNFSALRVGEDDYLQQVDGLVYGDDPRAGFFQGSLFLHPDLAFVMRFPEGWKTQNAPDAVTAISQAGDAVLEFRGAMGSGAEAARAFLTQEGMTATSQETRTIHGNRAIGGDFTAQTEGGETILGTATFIEYGGATWRIVGYAVPVRYEAARAEFRRTIESFDRLTDPAVLAVQPQTVKVERVSRAMTLQQFNALRPSAIPLAELALINGLEAGTMLQAGQSIKRVIGTQLSQVSFNP